MFMKNVFVNYTWTQVFLPFFLHCLLTYLFFEAKHNDDGGRTETTTTKKGCGNGCIINPHHTFTSHPILHLPDSFVAFVRVLLLKSGDAASKKGGSVLERGKVGSDAALDSAPRLWGGCRCAGAAAQRINGEAIPQLQRRELPCIRESGSGLAAVCAFPKP